MIGLKERKACILEMSAACYELNPLYREHKQGKDYRFGRPGRGMQPREIWRSCDAEAAGLDDAVIRLLQLGGIR